MLTVINNKHAVGMLQALSQPSPQPPTAPPSSVLLTSPDWEKEFGLTPTPLPEDDSSMTYLTASHHPWL